MNRYNRYIVISEFNETAICGKIHLSCGTVCYGHDGFLYCSMGKICSVKSQNAYDYFSRDDDGQGWIRGGTVKDILGMLRDIKADEEKNNILWDAIWADAVCLKYKRADFDDFWVWNYDFYNADICELEYIREFIQERM